VTVAAHGVPHGMQVVPGPAATVYNTASPAVVVQASLSLAHLMEPTSPSVAERATGPESLAACTVEALAQG